MESIIVPMGIYKIVWIYLGLVNLAAFCLFGADKRRAKKGRWRIPERTLLWSAALGGAPGALGGMLLFHHKTRKRKFSVGVPLLLAAQLLLLAALRRTLSL